MCHDRHVIVGYLIRNNHDTYFTSGLNGEGLLDALVGVRDVLKLLQTVRVGLEGLTTGTRTGCGNRIRCGDEAGNQGCRLGTAMM